MAFLVWRESAPAGMHPPRQDGASVLLRHVMRRLAAALSAIAAALLAREAAAGLEPHARVLGDPIEDAEIRGGSMGAAWVARGWDDLEELTLTPGRYEIRVRVLAGDGIDAVELPVCQVRGRIAVDGKSQETPARAPAVLRLAPGAHDVAMDVQVSAYEHRIACGAAPVAGIESFSRDGVGVVKFDSPHAKKGGGEAVVFLPPGHDRTAPAPLLVGVHPWNSDPWTYASYVEHLHGAIERDVVLLMPSGLGNSLYTAPAEDEVMRAIDALEAEVAIDPRAVSIWGASMGGAGATTIGFHHPDRFATITSFFGDATYEGQKYVQAILPDEAAMHAVNSLDIVENASHVPVWLIHGEQDHTSDIRQSIMLYQAMKARGYEVRFDRIRGKGHEGELPARFLPEIVQRAAEMRVPENVQRVRYWSVRPGDLGAYGVRIVRASHDGDAYVDVENAGGEVHVHRAVGVRAIRFARGALGTSKDGDPPRVVLDRGVREVETSWVAP